MSLSTSCTVVSTPSITHPLVVVIVGVFGGVRTAVVSVDIGVDVAVVVVVVIVYVAIVAIPESSAVHFLNYGFFCIVKPIFSSF